MNKLELNRIKIYVEKYMYVNEVHLLNTKYIYSGEQFFRYNILHKLILLS